MACQGEIVYLHGWSGHPSCDKLRESLPDGIVSAYVSSRCYYTTDQDQVIPGGVAEPSAKQWPFPCTCVLFVWRPLGRPVPREVSESCEESRAAGTCN